MSNFDNAKVKVEQGWLQGYIDGNLKVFKGVPYAAPPVGELRFKHPQDPRRWRGVRSAKEYSAAAIQHVMDDDTAPSNVHGVPQMLARSQFEEDCLYLNIWTPAKTPEDKLPVFIWIHGGGMVAGSGVECVCEGEGLAKRKDIIVVTINYRLGLFGFFAHPELTKEAGGTSGNYALYDMRKACEWVKKNIAAFGGDPDRITVAGQSGGAAGTGALLASPLMKGLVQRVSIESGPIYWGFMQPAPREEMEAKGEEFMRLAGCENIAQLREKDAWELFDLYEAHYGGGYSRNGFAFCIDGEFLTDTYTNMMDSGNFNDFDVLMGNCAQEFPIFPDGKMPLEDYYAYLEDAFADNVENMKKWYPANTPEQAAKQVATIASDIMLMGAIRIGQLCNQYGRRAYLWLMNKENETERGRLFGCPHCAEMPYLFGRVDTGERNPFLPYKWVDKDYAFMELVQGYWHAFCVTGNPNGEGRPEWKQFEDNFEIILLGNETRMISDDEKEKYAYYLKKLTERNTNAPTVSLGNLARI